MSGRNAAAADSSDDDIIDVTEYTVHGKKIKNSASAWTKEASKNMREEVEVAEAEAEFYRNIIDIFIARLDDNIESKDVDNLVLPPRVPSDVRKKLRKYRVEAKNILDFIDEKMEDSDAETVKKDAEEEAEAKFNTNLLETLGKAVHAESISPKFKLPRVPVVNTERKERMKSFRRSAGEIVEYLKKLKTQKIDKKIETDFPEEDPEWRIKQTKTTEYISTTSDDSKEVIETKKRKTVQRSRQTQTDSEDKKLSQYTVSSPLERPAGITLLHPPSYHTVMSDYVVSEGIAHAGTRPDQSGDLSKPISGHPGEQQLQQLHQIPYSITRNHSTTNKNDNVANTTHPHTSHSLNTQDLTNGGMNAWLPMAGQDGKHIHRQISKTEEAGFTVTGDDFNVDYFQFGKLEEKPSGSYIDMLERHILKLSCRISQLETQLYDSQRNLVVTAYTNDAVLGRVSKNVVEEIQASTREMSNLSDTWRPVKLAERFGSIYDREWLDIFQFETTQLAKSERDAIADILEILQSTYNICLRLASEQLESWQEQLRNGRKSELPEYLRCSRKMKGGELLKHLKETQTELAEDALGNVRKEVSCNEVMMSFYGPEMANCDGFMNACVDLCWMMVTKEPPIVLEFKFKRGSKLDKDIFRPYTKTGKKIDYMVWPPVFAHQDGQILQKGVVQPL